VKKAQPKEVMFSLQGGRGRARGGLFGRGICKSLSNDLPTMVDFLVENMYYFHAAIMVRSTLVFLSFNKHNHPSPTECW